MPNVGSPPENGEITNQQIVNFIMFVIGAWAISIEVFFRRNFGRRYLDGQAALVLVLVPVYALFWQHEDLQILYWFLGAYLLMCLRHRIAVLMRWNDQEPLHSYYPGESLLRRLRPQCDEIRFKLRYEPPLIALVGLVLTAINQPLGVYVMLGALCMWLMAAGSQYIGRTRTMDLQDQMIEQQWQAERFRQP